MNAKTNSPLRVGIYAGTFDPVHAGHLSFALQALKAGNLDVIYFLPERRPRNKAGVEHFGHRVAMLKRAVKPHRRLQVLELEDVSFTTRTTMPRLKSRFPGAQLVLLVGSDIAVDMQQWPHINQLFKQTELVVGIRSADKLKGVEGFIKNWQLQPKACTVIESYAATVSSRSIREALQRRQYVPGLLRSVQHYSNLNWLYVTLA